MKLEEFWLGETAVWESLKVKIQGRPEDASKQPPQAEVTGQLEKLQDELGREQARRAKATARREKAQADLATAKAKLAAEGSFGNIPAATRAARIQQARVQRHDGAIARASEHVAELEAGVALLNEALATVEAGLAAAEGSAITRHHFVRAIQREYEKAGRTFPGAPAGMQRQAGRGGP